MCLHLGSVWAYPQLQPKKGSVQWHRHSRDTSLWLHIPHLRIIMDSSDPFSTPPSSKIALEFIFSSWENYLFLIIIFQYICYKRNWPRKVLQLLPVNDRLICQWQNTFLLVCVVHFTYLKWWGCHHFLRRLMYICQTTYSSKWRTLLHHLHLGIGFVLKYSSILLNFIELFFLSTSKEQFSLNREFLILSYQTDQKKTLNNSTHC